MSRPCDERHEVWRRSGVRIAVWAGRRGSGTSARSQPSLYAADFTRLGEQIDALLGAGCRIFHFDVGDGHFIPPVTIGPVVLRSIAPMIHAAGGILDCHLMVADPAHHFAEFAESGADSVTFHVEATDDPRRRGRRGARRSGSPSASRSTRTPRSPTPSPSPREAGAELILCMSIEPGYSGQPFMPAAYGRIEELAALVEVPIQVDGGVGEANVAAVRDGGSDPVRRRERRLRRSRPGRRLPSHRCSRGMSLERALELARARRPASRIPTPPSAPSSSPTARSSARA